MGMFDSMGISATGMSAEQLRMDVTSENLANVDTTRTNGPGSGPYQRQEVVFQTIAGTPSSAANVTSNALGGASAGGSSVGMGVEAVGIVSDPSPPKQVYDPSNPDADQNGYVKMPNIDTVTEMVDMQTATRAYEANVTAMNAAKSMFEKSLDILR